MAWPSLDPPAVMPLILSGQVRPGEVATFNGCYLPELFCTEFPSFYTNKVEKLELARTQNTCSVAQWPDKARAGRSIAAEEDKKF